MVVGAALGLLMKVGKAPSAHSAATVFPTAESASLTLVVGVAFYDRVNEQAGFWCKVSERWTPEIFNI